MGWVANYSNDFDFARLCDVDTKAIRKKEESRENMGIGSARSDLLMGRRGEDTPAFPGRLIYIIGLLCKMHTRLV